jgi:hypothetical protein
MLGAFIQELEPVLAPEQGPCPHFANVSQRNIGTLIFRTSLASRHLADAQRARRPIRMVQRFEAGQSVSITSRRVSNPFWRWHLKQ